ncbi:hypothetical protein Enr13x_13810 [Stieleria neptunia]|uniref:Uncharacterized protein n=2 Tax=Stieleria neptunia TaxID=2527979 RepID=A0A518HL22_9BACT|nr:hypothetical protein Enr13x_13810 [Stieleria neptunia]
MTSVIVAFWSALLMHPVHETVCELEWNAETRRVEVALRIDVLDEQWMARTIQADTADDDTADDDWRANYLRSKLFFDPQIGRGERAETGPRKPGPPESGPVKPKPDKLRGRPIRWVGRKPDGGHVWWFFEVVCEDGRPPTSIQTRLLFDRHVDYQHRIVVLGKPVADNGKRLSILLTERQPSAALALVR